MDDFVVFFFVVIFLLGAGIAYGIYDICCRPAPSAEQVWVAKQDEKCRAMRSKLTYDAATRMAECYRTPFMRQPKLRFKEKYQGEQP